MKDKQQTRCRACLRGGRFRMKHWRVGWTRRKSRYMLYRCPKLRPSMKAENKSFSINDGMPITKYSFLKYNWEANLAAACIGPCALRGLIVLETERDIAGSIVTHARCRQRIILAAATGAVANDQIAAILDDRSGTGRVKAVAIRGQRAVGAHDAYSVGAGADKRAVLRAARVQQGILQESDEITGGKRHCEVSPEGCIAH